MTSVTDRKIPHSPDYKLLMKGSSITERVTTVVINGLIELFLGSRAFIIACALSVLAKNSMGDIICKR